jgi:hypothetical protein
MAAFVFRLETADGAQADPPKIESAVPNWRAGDTIPLGARTLRVLDVRYDEADDASVLVVEDMALVVLRSSANSDRRIHGRETAP